MTVAERGRGSILRSGLQKFPFQLLRSLRNRKFMSEKKEKLAGGGALVSGGAGASAL